uniref:ATP-dependent DNA helicase n=1 Tax=Arabidopsis thaliana TaxID=3702 RepID=Q9FYQ9_ARATH|nr:unnamed protein product [Arabidopsis thaliana]
MRLQALVNYHHHPRFRKNSTLILLLPQLLEYYFKRSRLKESELQQYTLIEVEKVMHQYEHSLTEFKDMPKPDLDVINELGNSLLTQESQYNVHKEKKDHIKLFSTLNVQQKEVYDAVMESVENGLGKLFFLYGPRGIGKTYLYSTIISMLRSEKKIVLPVALSGIATLLLHAGRTAHSRFKIPLDVNEDSIWHIRPGTMLAELIEKIDLIIWDEAPMTHRYAFKALDKTLRDLMSMEKTEAKDQHFGGKTVLLGGDFRQTLPVIPQATNADKSLSESTYANITERTILTPRNETVDEITNYMLTQLPRTSNKYFSSDNIGKADTISTDYESLYTVEYLNSLEFRGLPKHKLTLKVGAPIMLLRNLNQKEDLCKCNGTRLIITRLGKRLIEGEIVTGTHAGLTILKPHNDAEKTVKNIVYKEIYNGLPT